MCHYIEHTPSKVVVVKSSRTIPGMVSNSRKRNTIVGSINARGARMPPLIIMKGKTQKAVMSYNTAYEPVGARWTHQSKAWTEDILGVEWFTKIILKEYGNQRLQPLIMDNHHSHEVLGLIQKRLKRMTSRYQLCKRILRITSVPWIALSLVL